MNRAGISAKIDPQLKARLQELVENGTFLSLSSAVDRIIALGLSAYDDESIESTLRRVLREELSAYDGESMESTLRRVLREELSHMTQPSPEPLSANPKLSKLLEKTRK